MKLMGVHRCHDGRPRKIKMFVLRYNWRPQWTCNGVFMDVFIEVVDVYGCHDRCEDNERHLWT